mmetsp:Transcript_30848/g.67705  ORF Transcript_30848/g.67705 Transcript_30848/m.67705 type:complete len:547 (-) Transcript_30848:78-1718(-)
MEPATTTLADSLLDDLDDLSDVEEEEPDQQSADNTAAATSINSGPAPTTTSDGNGDEATNQLDAFRRLRGHDEVAGADDGAAALSRPKRRRLLDDSALVEHLASVRAEMTHNTGSGDGDEDSKPAAASASASTTQKDDDERHYGLIVASNKHLSRLREELSKAHHDLCAAYNRKFPELEELIADPLQYRAAVLAIGNEMDLTNVNDELNEVLTSNQILTVTVAGSTTAGRRLTDEEMAVVTDAADYIDAVRSAQAELTAYVESRMEGLAPSVCALLGPTTAARLVALAGGLAELSRIPACNLQVIGQHRQSAAARGGMSSTHGQPHSGVLMECDLVSKCPKYLQRKALKTVAAKLALAARCDYVNVETGRVRTADAGKKFRAEIESKIEKWEEPDKAQTVKALPKPDLTTKKRRGGKRIRRMKERFEETELMKQANKRAFSKETGEYGDDAMGLTLGMLDTKEGGNLRIATEKRKMRQANTKASRKRAIQMSSGTTNGLASSMVFTPVQGLELVNPDAQRDRVREANQKWFSQNAGFQSALPKKDK